LGKARQRDGGVVPDVLLSTNGAYALLLKDLDLSFSNAKRKIERGRIPTLCAEEHQPEHRHELC
jgi:hypothetical protein